MGCEFLITAQLVLNRNSHPTPAEVYFAGRAAHLPIAAG